MISQQKSIALVVSGVLFLTPPYPLFAATSSVETAASQQLTSQAEKFREEQKMRPLELQEKPVIVREKENAAPERIEGPRFTVKKIRVEGNTALPSAALESLIAPYENKETSFEELAVAADKITDAYIAAGHSTSQAYLPPQKVENGVVTIKVLEGKVGSVRVEGNQYFKSEIYEHAVRLRPDRLFSYQDLESSLYFLKEVIKLVKEKNYNIANIDGTIVTEEPILRPHIEPMRKKLAETLNIELDQISIKATRPEKMGALGRKEGLLALATVLLIA